MNKEELIPHLFRTEFSKITSVLCRTFGLDHMETAEDIASATFLTALETWPFKGVPENPVAWLYTVAKNKTRNALRRDKVFEGKVTKHLLLTEDEFPSLDIDLSDQNITDSQLRMLFALCHPSIPPESQIGLSLRILCGFGIEEIAHAFLTNKEVINKRLFRAREKLRMEKPALEFPGPAEIDKRLEPVLRTLYLLFSEGYYSESNDQVLRKDLCQEAMRLTRLLIENEGTRQPPVHALLSLMCFHASRFDARVNEEGRLILYNEQDESRWNEALIEQGAYHLRQSSAGNLISKYHFEAAIAYWHTRKADTKEKWEAILHLYDQLLQIDNSPIVALNRILAVSKVKGKAAAIAEAERLELAGNHYYFTLLGELYEGIDNNRSKMHYETAYQLAGTSTDKQLIHSRIQAL